ncbi:MAG TPA: ribosome-associated translation inhibitor RaiA [Chlamydiales bacterium]|jgi:putative sigma-54 modulation protein|nr:ribosome-associated translation inhibitor RaiA [Chlamydiales bacterium]
MAKPVISPDAGYNVSVIGKHFQITDAIRNYVFEKLAKVDRLAEHIIDVTVTLDAQKLEHSCSIFMNFVHFHIKVHASTENMYSAIDRCTDRLMLLMRKYKTKLQSHRGKDLSTVDIHVNVIKPLSDDLKIVNEEIEAETAHEEEERYKLHEIVAKETMPLKTLTHDEALMKMEITDEPVLIFRSEEDQKIKVIYRRHDANYGLVQVQ